MAKLPDLVDRKFGRWSVIAFVGLDAEKNRQWLCRCSCERRTVRILTTDKLGRSRSCGCLRKERCKELLTSHGGSELPEYDVYNGMIARCTNPKHKGYYGGRKPPITVYEPWLHSFETFLTDVLKKIGPRPSPKHTLDRRNNNGNYEPGNIWWRTRKEQARNRRSNRIITIDNITGPLAAVCEKLDLPCERIGGLIRESGYTLQAAADFSDASRNLRQTWCNRCVELPVGRSAWCERDD